LLRQPAQERLGCAPVTRRLDAERAECATPRRETRNLAERPVPDPLESSLLLVVESLAELGARVAVDDAARVNDTTDDGREAIE